MQLLSWLLLLFFPVLCLLWGWVPEPFVSAQEVNSTTQLIKNDLCLTKHCKKVQIIFCFTLSIMSLILMFLVVIYFSTMKRSSVTKRFIAIFVLILEEEKKLRNDCTASRCLFSNRLVILHLHLPAFWFRRKSSSGRTHTKHQDDNMMWSHSPAVRVFPWGRAAPEVPS